MNTCYDENATMRLLGKQKMGEAYWANEDVRNAIKEISEGRPFSFTLDAAADIFTLGYIFGKRAERARRRNAGNVYGKD